MPILSTASSSDVNEALLGEMTTMRKEMTAIRKGMRDKPPQSSMCALM
jgi:hypothetical protein